jgi:hypothetical protein
LQTLVPRGKIRALSNSLALRQGAKKFDKLRIFKGFSLKAVDLSK